VTTSSEWKPIADAPRDGTWMMVSCVRPYLGGLHIEKCQWAGHYWSTPNFGNRFASGIVEPTHFMPSLDHLEGAL
jgi:hypothetical protein